MRLFQLKRFFIDPAIFCSYSKTSSHVFLQVSGLRTLRNMKPNSDGNSLATLTTSVEVVIQYDVDTLTFADLIQLELTKVRYENRLFTVLVDR